MLGRQSVHAAACFADRFIGADFDINQDLSVRLPHAWWPFNAAINPVFLAGRPEQND